MKLSRRLLMVASLVPADAASLADIGAYDGHLALFLKKERPSLRVIASDRSPEILRRGPSLARKLGIEGVEWRQGEGLSVLRPGDVEGVILAGLGGQTIAQILEEGKKVFKNLRWVVAQPMRGDGHLRRFFWRQGWHLWQEDLVQEKGRYYVAMAVGRERGPWEGSWPSREEDPLFDLGPFLYARAHPLLKGYGERTLFRRGGRRILPLEKELQRRRGGDGDGCLRSGPLEDPS